MPIAKILIVEDEPIVAKDIRQSLERLGFSIAGIAGNGNDAIRLTAETKPDAILMDIVLSSGMDGIETAKKINEQFNIPIIYLTAHQDKHTIEKSKTTKPYGFILKPLDDRDLNACLRMALYRFDTEKKLRESEERYFRLSENAKDMIFRISLVNGVYEYVNKAALDLTGYSPNEFYSSPMLIEKIIHPDWKNYFRQQWENLKSGDMPGIYEFQIINKSGEARWLNQRNVLIKNISGIPVALEGIVTDVTERKKTEALIKKQSEEYRLILDSMPAMVLVKDYNNKLIRVNKLAALRKGVNVEDMEGRYSEEFYSGQSEEDIKADREIMISGKPKLNSIEFFTNGTAEKKWVKVDRFPYRNEKGEIEGVIVFSQDITDQKKAEDELKKIEAKNAAILDALPDFIFIMDSEGRTLEYKAKDVKQLPIPPSEFMGKKAIEFMPEHIAKNIELCIKKAFETGEVQVYEYGREVNNKIREFELRFVICGENEVLALARDITERKQFSRDSWLKKEYMSSQMPSLSGKAASRLMNLIS
jgi:PAS domain S-box-containing protein